MKQRIVTYDYIRAIAIVLVVCIHSQQLLTDTVAVEANTFGIAHMCAAFWHVISVAVPLFVMLSGALLLGKEDPLPYFFKRRFTRVLIPFLIWSVVLGVMLFYKKNHTLSGCLEWIVTQTFSSGIYHVYWYVYLILGLYLITPIIRLAILYGGKTMLKYMVVMVFSLWLADLLFPNFDLVNRFDCDNLLYIGYFLIGYLICNPHASHDNRQSKALLVIGMFVLYIVGIIINLYAPDTKISFIALVAEAIALFYVLSRINYDILEKSRLISGGVKLLSEISYGMYLTHCAFISLLVSMPWIRDLSIVIEPLVLAIGATILSALFILVLKRIGLKKWIM